MLYLDGFSGTSKPVIRLALVPIDPKLGADSIKVSFSTHKFTLLKIIKKIGKIRRKSIGDLVIKILCLEIRLNEWAGR